MKKKIVNAFLVMAVTMPSVGSLVSCKDYNEDLSTELKSDLAKEASLREALQTQVNSLKATVEAIKSCECDLTKFYEKAEADAKFATVASVQSCVDKIAANKAAIDQLKALIDAINAKLAGLGDKPVVDQINELNTTIINVKAIADEALELAKNGGKCTCDFTEINKKISDLQELVAGWDAKLTEVNTKAANALAKAETNEAWINANKETIDALKELVGKDVLGRLQTIESNYMKKDDITALVNEAKAAADEAKTVAQNAMSKAEQNATKIGTVETTVGQLEETVKTLVTKDELKAQIDEVNGSIDKLAADIDKIDAELVKIKGDLTKMITGIIAQGTENPVLGYFNTPFGINQYLLAAYYGKADNGMEFPARDAKYYLEASDIDVWTPRSFEVMGISSLKDIQGYFTKGDERFVADVNGDVTGNAGTIYVTVNPSSVNFTGQVMSLESSAKNESPITLSPLEPSNAELNMGVFRDTRSVENGFYQAKATLKAEDIDKAKVTVDFKGIEDAIKLVLKERTRISVAEAAGKVMTSLQNDIPAYGLKASWTDADEQAHDIFSQYNLATVAIKPLSFAFMKDKTFNHVEGFGRTRSVIARVIAQLEVKVPNFPAYEFQFKDVDFGKDITVDENGRILVKVTGVLNGKTASGETVTVDCAIDDVYGDATETIKELVDAINANYGAGSEANQKMAEFFNEVYATNNFQTYVEDAKASAYAAIDKYWTRIENHILRVMNNAHRSLYITMFGLQDNKVALLSRDLVLPTKASNGELTLVPTTYSMQYFAPIYKKFVAVTNVYDAKTKAELDVAEAKSLAAAANGGENMFKVVDGMQNCTLKGEAGKIYELTYTAVDYLGVVMIKKFYVEF